MLLRIPLILKLMKPDTRLGLYVKKVGETREMHTSNSIPELWFPSGLA